MTIKVQLALQGGGAKVAALMAAMRAVEQLVDSKVIEVTRVSGTSAGSLVATLFAAGVRMDSAITTLENKDMRDVFPHSRWPLLLKIYFGKPIYKVEESLKGLIRELLSRRPRSPKKLGPAPVSFKDLDIPTFVQISDLRSRSSATREGEDPIIASLVDSCSLPFGIKTFKSQSAFLVDGGLVDNLPAEILFDGSPTHGPVLAFSFPREVGSDDPGLLAYALSLLLTPIDCGVKRSKQLLGEGSVHEIDTSITTLDFPKIFGSELKKLSHELSSIENSALAFLKKWTASQQAPPPTLTPGVSQVKGNPWATALTSSPASTALAKSLKDAYKMHQATCNLASLEYRTMRLVVKADSLRALDGLSAIKGEVVQTDTLYEVSSGSLVTHAVTIAVDASNLLRSMPTVEKDVDGSFIPIDAVFNAPAIDESDPSKRYMVMCFTRPLQAGTKFRISLRDEVEGMVSGLLDADSRSDYLFIKPNRHTEARVLCAQIIVLIPELQDYVVSLRPHASMGDKTGRQMSAEELRNSDTSQSGFKAIGWQWDDVAVPTGGNGLMVAIHAHERRNQPCT